MQVRIPSFRDLEREWLGHSLRTAIAATVSLLIARLFQLPEAYWAAITTIVILQSTLGGALKVSGQRLAGTALGAAAGAVLSAYFGESVVAFTVGVFALGVLCCALRLDRPAYRFAGITLTIVMLIHYARPAWVVALHRFVEVSVGIIVGLALTALWPERPTIVSAATTATTANS
jgi:uncharacterized membrane protein YgaE (UPF0421/DUF939 family)